MTRDPDGTPEKERDIGGEPAGKIAVDRAGAVQGAADIGPIGPAPVASATPRPFGETDTPAICADREVAHAPKIPPIVTEPARCGVFGLIGCADKRRDIEAGGSRDDGLKGKKRLPVFARIAMWFGGILGALGPCLCCGDLVAGGE